MNTAYKDPAGLESNNSATVWRKVTINDKENVCSDFQVKWHNVLPGRANWVSEASFSLSNANKKLLSRRARAREHSAT